MAYAYSYPVCTTRDDASYLAIYSCTILEGQKKSTLIFRTKRDLTARVSIVCNRSFNQQELKDLAEMTRIYQTVAGDFLRTSCIEVCVEAQSYNLTLQLLASKHAACELHFTIPMIGVNCPYIIKDVYPHSQTPENTGLRVLPLSLSKVYCASPTIIQTYLLPPQMSYTKAECEELIFMSVGCNPGRVREPFEHQWQRLGYTTSCSRKELMHLLDRLRTKLASRERRKRKRGGDDEEDRSYVPTIEVEPQQKRKSKEQPRRWVQPRPKPFLSC